MRFRRRRSGCWSGPGGLLIQRIVVGAVTRLVIGAVVAGTEAVRVGFSCIVVIVVVFGTVGIASGECILHGVGRLSCLFDGNVARDGGELGHARNTRHDGADADDVGERGVRRDLLAAKGGGSSDEEVLEAIVQQVRVGRTGDIVGSCCAEGVDRVGGREGILKEDALALVEDAMTDLEGGGVRVGREVGEGRLKVPEGEKGDVHRLVASSEDEAFERSRLGGFGDEEVAELRPVELDLMGRKGGLELADEVVGDANVVRVSTEVGEGEVGRKVVGMEETQQETRHDDGKMLRGSALMIESK